MTEIRQIPLALPHRAALGRADFLVAPANRDAVAWIERWPDWPAPGLVLQGPAGAGKSHLAGLWRRRAAAGLIDGATLTLATVADLAEGGPTLLVEAADTAPERPLLHLYNALAERRGHLLLTARLPPSAWSIALADLRSRLVALPVATIFPPADDLIRAVLIKLFADRQVSVATEVIDFLVLRIERSFDAAERIVAELDEAALADHRPITIPLAREVLGDRSSDGNELGDT